MTHTLSATGFTLVKKFEGFRAEAFPLPQGGWVLGYGHVRVGEPGAPLSKNEAAELLALDLAPIERLVNAKVTAPIKQSQFDALVSFAFSIGEEAFLQSQALRRVNACEYVAAACALDAWRKGEVDGEVQTVETLVRRRAAEKALFLRDMPLSPSPSALLRAKLDHAASILGAPTKKSPPILVPAAAPRPSPAQRLTVILKSESATEALLLTQIAPDAIGDEGELTTAHAAPVARRAEGMTRHAPSFKMPRVDFGLAAENFGLVALMLFGLTLVSVGASIVFGGRGDGANMLAGSAVFVPGFAASLMAGFSLWSAPRLKPVRA
ncbi:MAG: lysozyme [Terricaulis sp.]